MKNSSAAANDPAQAHQPRCQRLRLERSTSAPTIGSRKALAMVAKLVRYDGSEPAARCSPSTSTVFVQVSSAAPEPGPVPQPAARPATVIMNGPNSTVSTVV